ncbi:MAG: copper amine oxidase N-terminal domain-containing protein [Oscillospiraceae bacterium]|nr:copper amine oxidase N-terminal domain-containing protein [Oscillospiraceae bacterium]
MIRKRKTIISVLMAAILALGAATAFALNSDIPEGATSVTARFFEVASNEDGSEFTMASADGEYQIRVTGDTEIYFEDYVPLSDECDGMTKMVREVLFGRTLVEVLEGRNMVVILAGENQTEAVSIRILFETAVHLPAEIADLGDFATDGGYVGIATLPAEIDWDDFGQININGEIVVNGELIESTHDPFLDEANNVVMVPVRAVANALGFDVNWDGVLGSVRFGVATHIWIGRTEAHVGRMAPIELSAAPVVIDGATFVPIDFFRSVLAREAYVFEGQVVVN